MSWNPGRDKGGLRQDPARCEGSTGGCGSGGDIWLNPGGGMEGGDSCPQGLGGRLLAPAGGL